MPQSLNLSRKQKAAILLMSLPPEDASRVFQSLSPEDVKSVTLEMSNLPHFPPEIKAAVIEEFFQATEGRVGDGALVPPASPAMEGGRAPRGGGPVAGHDSATRGGERLSEFGRLKGEERDSRTSESSAGHHDPGAATTLGVVPGAREGRAAKGRPFEFLRRVDPTQIAALIRREHPQTIAVILSHLLPSQASGVLGEFGSVQQTEVAKRLAEIGRVSPEVMGTIEEILEGRLISVVDGDATLRGEAADGKEVLVEILNRADRATEQKILAGLTKRDPRLATQLKHQLCEFSDLAGLDEQAIQQVLRITDIRDLVLALKGAPKEIAEKIYHCMSTEAAQALREDVENLDRAEWNDIKAAQQQIRNNLRGLITIGKIKFG